MMQTVQLTVRCSVLRQETGISCEAPTVRRRVSTGEPMVISRYPRLTYLSRKHLRLLYDKEAVRKAASFFDDCYIDECLLTRHNDRVGKRKASSKMTKPFGCW